MPKLFKKYQTTEAFLYAYVGFAVLSLTFFLIALSNSAPAFDDSSILEHNVYLKNYDFTKLTSTPFWEGVHGPANREKLFRPLFLVFAALFQTHWKLFQVLVVFSHALAVTLFSFLLFRELSQKKANKETAFVTSIGAGLLMLVHPANAEILAQGVGLMETMALCHGLLALVLAPTNPVLSIVTVAFAPGWKEIGLFWILAIGIYFATKKKWNYTLGAAGIFLYWFTFRLQIFHGSLRTEIDSLSQLFNPLANVNFTGQIWNQLAILGQHIKIFFVPTGLTSEYTVGVLPLPAMLFSFLPFLGIAGVAFFCYRVRSSAFWVSTLILSVLMTLDVKRMVSPFADRYGYGMRFGMVAMVLLFVWEFRKNLPQKLVLAPVFLLLIWAWQFETRLSDWRNDLVLFQKDVQLYPHAPRHRFNLGIAFAKRTDWAKAQDQFEKAIALFPTYPHAHYRLSQVFKLSGQTKLSERHLAIAGELGYPIPRLPSAVKNKNGK